MPVEYQGWELTSAEQKKFSDWMARIMVGHTGTTDVRNQRINWTPPARPLSEAVVGLFTTGGVHLKSDTPFDVTSAHGDWTFRRIPGDADTADLTITHTHYNHVDADRDVNCMFPLDRLRELKRDGVIGDVAPCAYTIMGFNPDPAKLTEETAPEVARRFQADGVDLVFMTCG
jgi:D-proline reductase (dithiol) PrdB